MDFYKHYYYINKDGTEDCFCTCLNCWEQFFYFILRYYPIDYKKIFCEDLNILFYPDSKETDMSIFAEFLKYVTIEEEKNSFSPEKSIQGILKEGKIALIQTQFNLLPSYGWYYIDQKKPHIDHFMGIVGMDSKDYHFIDSPWVIKKEIVPTHPANPTIFRISKKELLNAMSVFSIIQKIDVLQDKIQENSGHPFVDDISRMIARIVKNYWNAELKEKNYYIGRKAIILLKETVYNDSLYQTHLLNESFNCHIMYSRHLILKWCLEDIEYLKDKTTTIKCLSDLDACMKIWQNLKFIAFRNEMRPKKQFPRSIAYLLGELIKCEDRLMNHLDFLF